MMTVPRLAPTDCNRCLAFIRHGLPLSPVCRFVAVWFLASIYLCGCSGPPALDVGGVLAPSEPGRIGDTFSEPTLTLEDARCRSAVNAVQVPLIEIERRLASELGESNPCVTAELRELIQQLLNLRSALRANEAAEKAIELFFRMAEGQHQTVVLTESLAEVEAMLADLQRLREQGFDLPVDREPLERQRLQLLDRHREVTGQIAQGWSQLNVLLGGGSCEVPVCSLTVPMGAPTDAPSCEEAMRTALQMGPELRILRLLRSQVNADSLPVVVAALQQVESSLGTATSLDTWQQFGKLLELVKPLTRYCRQREVDARTSQLDILLGRKELATQGDVEAALAAWQTAADRWRLAEQRIANWQEQLERLQQEQDIDESVTVFDLSEARLGRLQAEGEKISAFFAWKQAQRQLWKAQGVTAAGCGLANHNPYWCESCQQTHGLLHSAPPVSTPVITPPAEPFQLAPPPAPTPVGQMKPLRRAIVPAHFERPADAAPVEPSRQVRGVCRPLGSLRR